MPLSERLRNLLASPHQAHALAAHPKPRIEHAVPITRALVQKALYDSDDQTSVHDAEDVSHRDPSPKYPALRRDSASTTVNETLQATKKWLEAEAKAEERNVDPASEFKFEKVVHHPKGSNLPQFSTAEELQSVVNPNDLLIPQKNPGMAIDGKMMDRLHAGRGPRSPKPEDLIERLRLGKPRSSTNETYEELLGVLQAWNLHVSRTPHLHEKQAELLDALHERCRMITDVERKLKRQNDLDHQCLRLRQALHAFRPELIDFKDQSIRALLIVSVANFRVAVPDFDENIKSSMIETLYREFRLSIYTSKEHTARRERIKAEMRQASSQGDETAIRELVEQRTILSDKSKRLAAERTLDVLRLARRNLHAKALGELQSLAELQAGQKWAASEGRQTSISNSLERCDQAEDVAYEALREYAGRIGEQMDAAAWSMGEMLRLSRDCAHQVDRFAALDISNVEEREKVKQQRIDDAATAEEMMNVVDQGRVLQDVSRRTIRRMAALESIFDAVRGAANRRFREYDSLLAAIGDEESYPDAKEYAVQDG